MKFGISLFIIIVVLVGMAVFSPSARAELVTIQIEGVVDEVDDSFGLLAGEITQGTAITGTYTLDSSAIDLHAETTTGRYRLTNQEGIRLDVGGMIFRTSMTPTDFFLEISNDYPSSDDYYHLYSSDNAPVANIPVRDISWRLGDSSGIALSSDMLPTIAPNVLDWDFNSFRISGSEFDGRPPGKWFGIDGHITSAVVVPEPATICLLGMGVLALRKRRKRE